MSTDPAAPSRRAFLAAGLLLPLAACARAADPDPPPDPDLALRATSVARERELLALYDRALAAEPARATLLTALRDEHAAHLTALLGAPATPTSTALTPAVPGGATPLGPVPAAGPVALNDLNAAEVAAAAAHADGVPAASRPLAAVLATLSAAEASHAVALA